jgi:predicted HTH domain antitoxin
VSGVGAHRPLVFKHLFLLQKTQLMVLHLPDEIILPLNLSEFDLLTELAVALYAAQKISFGKARELSGLNWVRFRQILAARNIPAHYTEEDFNADLAALSHFSET